MFARSYTRRDFIAGGAVAGASLSFGCALGQPSDPADLTIEEASRLIRERSISPVELVRAYLERINRLNPDLNAFITVTEELAYEQAQEREAELDRGFWRGPLHGIPVALKDNIDTAGIRTTAGSGLFADRVPGPNWGHPGRWGRSAGLRRRSARLPARAGSRRDPVRVATPGVRRSRRP